LLVLRREQVHDGQAAVGPPRLGDLQHLLVAGQLVEPVDAPDRPAQRQVALQDHVVTVESDDQEALHRPRADARYRGQGGQDHVVRAAPEELVAEFAGGEPLGQSAQRLDLAPGQARAAQPLRFRGHDVLRLGQPPAEQGLHPADDGPRGGDGQLLPDDLEQQGPVGIHRRELLQPGPRVEVRMLVDQRRDHRVRVPQVRPRLGEPVGHHVSGATRAPVTS
jgi:hypothetical protein